MSSLEIRGEFACFTRPELKVERMSYPAPTPSAIRAIYEAIYWKPQFRWEVQRIELLSVPRFISLRRNEVKDRVPSERTVWQWMDGTREIEPLVADGDREALGTDMKGRTQRQTQALKDVHYRVRARPVPWPEFAGERKKYEASFERRARRGQCVAQPYLGCREFPAYFQWLDDGAGAAPPSAVDLDIGWMVYDTFDLSRRGSSSAPAAVSLFDARIRNGVLEVPAYDSPDVRKSLPEVL